MLVSSIVPNGTTQLKPLRRIRVFKRVRVRRTMLPFARYGGRKRGVHTRPRPRDKRYQRDLSSVFKSTISAVESRSSRSSPRAMHASRTEQNFFGYTVRIHVCARFRRGSRVSDKSPPTT